MSALFYITVFIVFVFIVVSWQEHKQRVMAKHYQEKLEKDVKPHAPQEKNNS